MILEFELAQSQLIESAVILILKALMDELQNVFIQLFEKF
jgi:hypothetical protein